MINTNSGKSHPHPDNDNRDEAATH